MKRNFLNRFFCAALMLVSINLYTMQQSADANQFLYKKITNHAHQHALDRLTEESYISPEMQWAVLSFLGMPEMVINKVTGAVENFPSVNHLLGQINYKMQSPGMTSTIKESMKNALHAMLEATDIAIFVAAIEAAYLDQKYLFKQTVNEQLSFALNQQKESIQSAIKAVSEVVTYDEQDSNSGSFFSWIPSFGFGSSQQPQPIMNSSESLPVPVHGHVIAIPARLMPTIIATNNYKTMTDPNQAANLLFKECFIAQQHHLKDQHRIKQIAINLKGTISQFDYVFTNFPNIEQIISIAQQCVTHGQVRVDVQAPVSPQQAQAHALLLHIRQSLQAALYIANNRSSFNVGYILPASVRSRLGGIVGELTKYDSQLDELCKNPQFGATQEDLYRSEQLWQITKLAAGTIGAATVTGLAFMYGGPVGAGAANRVIAVGKAVFSPEKDSAMAKVYNVGGKVIAGAAAVGGTASAVSSVAEFAQWADEEGFIPQGLVDEDMHEQARNFVKTVGDTSKNIAVVGNFATAAKGVAGGAKGAYGAWTSGISGTWADTGEQYEQSNALWRAGKQIYNTAGATQDAINATKGSVKQAKTLYKDTTGAVKAGTTAYQSLRKLAGLETSQDYRHPQGSPDQISTIFMNVVMNAVNQNLIAADQLKNAAYNLLQNKVPPMHVIQGLQIVQQKAPSELEFNQIGMIIQDIATTAGIKLPSMQMNNGGMMPQRPQQLIPAA